jgi:hypothetical protein
MNRRKFLGQTVGMGAAAWAAARAFGRPRPLCPPSPRGPFPNPDAEGRHLIIPNDKPDHFNLKVMEFNPVAARTPKGGSSKWSGWSSVHSNFGSRIWRSCPL